MDFGVHAAQLFPSSTFLFLSLSLVDGMVCHGVFYEYPSLAFALAVGKMWIQKSIERGALPGPNPLCPLVPT